MRKNTYIYVDKADCKTNDSHTNTNLYCLWRNIQDAPGKSSKFAGIVHEL